MSTPQAMLALPTMRPVSPVPRLSTPRRSSRQPVPNGNCTSPMYLRARVCNGAIMQLYGFKMDHHARPSDEEGEQHTEWLGTPARTLRGLAACKAPRWRARRRQARQRLGPPMRVAGGSQRTRPPQQCWRSRARFHTANCRKPTPCGHLFDVFRCPHAFQKAEQAASPSLSPESCPAWGSSSTQQANAAEEKQIRRYLLVCPEPCTSIALSYICDTL